jgi:hypothetical protein
MEQQEQHEPEEGEEVQAGIDSNRCRAATWRDPLLQGDRGGQDRGGQDRGGQDRGGPEEIRHEAAEGRRRGCRQEPQVYTAQLVASLAASHLLVQA